MSVNNLFYNWLVSGPEYQQLQSSNSQQFNIAAILGHMLMLTYDQLWSQLPKIGQGVKITVIKGKEHIT